MMFETSSPVFEFINRLLGFWVAVAALVILLNLLIVKREKNKTKKVYRLFLYVAGLSFIYSMTLTGVHQSVAYYHSVSDYDNYISTNQEAILATIFSIVLYVFYYKLVKQETTLNRVVIVLLGVFSTIAVYIGLLDYLS